jgi:Repeat of unknown function (DUF5648)
MSRLRTSMLITACLIAALSPPASAQVVTAEWISVFAAPGDRWHMTIYKDEIRQMPRRSPEWKQLDRPALAFPTQAKGTVPLYRYFNPQSGDHFFTLNHEEGLNAVRVNGYQDEGVCCYVSPQQVSGTVPIFRLLKGAHHRYVFSASVRDSAISREGWQSEGDEGYAWLPTRPSQPTLPAQ